MALDTNLKRLQVLLGALDSDNLSKQDFVKAFRAVTDLIKKNDAKNAQVIQEAVTKLERKFDKTITEIERNAKDTTSVSSAELKRAVAKLEKEQQATMNFMRDKVRSLRDGKDADEDAMVDKIIDRLAQMIPDMPELEIPRDIPEAIAKNAEDIEELRKDMKVQKSTQRVGGGTSAVSVAQAMKFLIKNETPTGDIDGNNTTYTVNRNISAVLSFGINGMVIHPSEYSYSGRTITMNTALDASLSGTTFQITYV